MNYYKNNIRHVKGDTLAMALIVEGLGQEFESIYFTCRNNLNDDGVILFAKSLYNGISLIEYDEEHDIRKYMIRIDPYDTKDLQAGTYFYDEQVAVNGDVFTIMKGKFIIEQDVTRTSEIPYDPELYIKVYLDVINGEVIESATIDKLDYLNETKSQIKGNLNDLFDAEIQSNDTFRSYVTKIDELYSEYPGEELEGV